MLTFLLSWFLGGLCLCLGLAFFGLGVVFVLVCLFLSWGRLNTKVPRRHRDERKDKDETNKTRQEQDEIRLIQEERERQGKARQDEGQILRRGKDDEDETIS
jgi:hypothetical protein